MSDDPGAREVRDDEPLSNLKQAIDTAWLEDRKENGNCCMCTVGDKPYLGKHRGKHLCGNSITCLLCHGCMPVGEQCAGCLRIRQEEEVP